ncbi:MAG: Lrp/AsnC family transcriptional regulator, partial [Candidatus Puniceispirillum sp.]
MIHLLAADGRMPVNELAEKVNLSPTPVSRRLKRLEQEGIITGYSALIDERQMGFNFSVFVSVRLEKQIDDVLARIENAVTVMPEVVDCWLMTGNHDYLLSVVTRD